MENNELQEKLKIHLIDYVNRITKPDPKAGKNKYKCPICGSGSHGGRNSDGAFSINDAGLLWYCFSCNNGGDLFDLIGKYENIPEYKEQVKRAEELYLSPKAELAPAPAQKKEAARIQEAHNKPGLFDSYIKQCAADAGATDYFNKRGFTPETITRFSLGYDRKNESIVIPYDETNSYYITRNTNKKEFRKPPTDQAGQEPVFNAGALYTGAPCFICESPIDAMSIIQAGGNAAAVGGTGSQKLINQVIKEKPAGILILSFDNDTAGKRATEAAANDLKAQGIKFIIASYSLDNYSGERKDPNDLLRANEEQLTQDIKQNIKAARNKAAFVSFSAKDYLTGGDYESDIAYFKKYQDRKTGFFNIDKYITLYPGLAALGGSASLGKSTFAVNIADNLLKAGETVLYFALEQEPIELITKSIARRLYEIDPLTPLTNIEIKNGAKDEKLEAVKHKYAEEAEKFIIIRCNFTITAEEIRDYVEEFIKQTKTRPIVFIDYLQLISPPLDFKGDTRNATDHIVKTFKTMQRDNELFVVMISNFNRNSYVVPVSYEAFKETGMIEFTCDYVWGLQLSVLEDENFYLTAGARGGERETSLKTKRDKIYNANRENPKEVEFVSLKNRNGRQTFKAFFKYYMSHDIFVPEKKSPHDRDEEPEQNDLKTLSDEELTQLSFDFTGIKAQ